MESQTPDLLEIREDRDSRTSTLLATQIAVANWHDRLGNATFADAVMDRIIHNTYRLEVQGISMRKRRSPLTHSGYKASLRSDPIRGHFEPESVAGLTGMWS